MTDQQKPRLAHSIELITRMEGDWPRVELIIDGERFPWFILDDSVVLKPSTNEPPFVTLSIPAESVISTHTMTLKTSSAQQKPDDDA